MIVTIVLRSAPISLEGDVDLWAEFVGTFNITVAVLFVLPACYLLSRRTLATGSVDNALLYYLAAECLGVMILSRASTGAWVNYGIQAVIFASILTARRLIGRATSSPPHARSCRSFWPRWSFCAM